jgi:hypothetical protein
LISKTVTVRFIDTSGLEPTSGTPYDITLALCVGAYLFYGSPSKYPAHIRVPATHWAVKTVTKIKSLVKRCISTGTLAYFHAIPDHRRNI